MVKAPGIADPEKGGEAVLKYCAHSFMFPVKFIFNIGGTK
jgi:hypothetical protein